MWILLPFLDRAADRFSAFMDTKVDSMMDRLEKRIDEKIDSKTWPCDGQVVGAEENQQQYEKWPFHGGSTGQTSATGVAPAVFALAYLEMKGWCEFRDWKHTWPDGGSG